MHLSRYICLKWQLTKAALALAVGVNETTCVRTLLVVLGREKENRETFTCDPFITLLFCDD